MLFFMGAASHLPMSVNPAANLWILVGVLALILGAVEWNALKGKPGPMTTIQGVIGCGFALAAVLYTCVEIFTK